VTHLAFLDFKDDKKIRRGLGSYRALQKAKSNADLLGVEYAVCPVFVNKETDRMQDQQTPKCRIQDTFPLSVILSQPRTTS